MTPQELKEILKGMTLPETHRMSDWENVSDVRQFLNSHFYAIDCAGDHYLKDPVWERLLRFYESLSATQPADTL